MENITRYKELVFKAQQQIKRHSDPSKQLLFAVIELSYMRKDSMSDQARKIFEDCTTEKPKSDEGSIKATIDKMSLEKIEQYINQIKMLG